VDEALDLGGRQDGGGGAQVLVLAGRADERRGLGAVVGILLCQE